MDHAALATFIRAQGYAWLLSYDDHPRIRELYANNQMQPIYLDYKVKSNRTAQELVISNLQIPPPIYDGCRKDEISEQGRYEDPSLLESVVTLQTT